MIRNVKAVINLRRIVECYIYKVNIESKDERGDIECLGNAYFYKFTDAVKFCLKHCNDRGVYVCDIYRAYEDVTADGYCKTWEDVEIANEWNLWESHYSDLYFENNE